MRIVFAIDSLGIGGTELNATRTAGELVRRGHTVDVVHFSPEGPALPAFRQSGATLHALPFYGLATRSAASAAPAFLRLIRRIRPDVVHTLDIYANIFAAPLARLAGTPRVVASRRWIDAPRRRGLALTNTIASRFAHAIVANSAAAVQRVIRETHVDPCSVFLTPNFLSAGLSTPEDRAHGRRELASRGIPTSSLVIGCVAQLRTVKRHDVLLRAVALLRPTLSFHLVLIGDGPERSRLLALAQELGISGSVTFAGQVLSGKNLHNGFDISVLFSDSEASPNSLFEAAAAGVPIVATAVGGIVDAFTHEENALLVEPNDPAAASAAIDRVLSDDALGAFLAGRALSVAKRHTVESGIDALERAYTGEVLSQKTASNRGEPQQ